MFKTGDVSIASFSEKVEGFSSGYGLIDVVSGVPGVLFPRATITELFGLKSSSKTTLVLETIAYNQLINPEFKVLYVDYEKMLRKEYPYLRKLGIDTSPEKFVCLTPDFMEDGCEATLKAIREGDFDMIVTDTIAAMRPKAEVEKGFGNQKQMGLKAKLMSEFLRNIMADLQDNGPAVVFINQMYKDINASSFIQTYVTPSSDSLKFYAAMRIEVKQREKLKDKIINPYTLEEHDIPIGSVIEIKTEKNKVGPPFLVSRYMITYGIGIDIIPSMISAAIKAGVIYNKGKSRSVYLYKLNGVEQPSINGMSNLVKHFRENPDIACQVGSQISTLWKEEMDRFKLRLKVKSIDLGDSEFEVDTEEDGEEKPVLDLDLDSDSDEEKELDLDTALASGKKVRKKAQEDSKSVGTAPKSTEVDKEELKSKLKLEL